MATSSSIGRSLLNGAGIVVSILLAFAIDAAWDERQEREIEAALLDGLRVEFESNLERLREVEARYRHNDSLLVHFYEVANPRTEAEARTEVENATLGLIWAEEYDPSTGTLEAILNAGRLDVISDADLRNRLSTWKLQIEDLQDDTGGFRSFIDRGREILGRLGARGYDAAMRPPWLEQFRRIRASPELNALAHTTRLDRGNYHAELMRLLETTEGVLRALR